MHSKKDLCAPMMRKRYKGTGREVEMAIKLKR